MATKTARMFETRIDLDQASREKLIALLNARLADTFDLYSQLKQAHWSVRGSDFIQLHELYDTLAESVLGFVDEIAERADRPGRARDGNASDGGRGDEPRRVPDRRDRRRGHAPHRRRPARSVRGGRA